VRNKLAILAFLLIGTSACLAENLDNISDPSTLLGMSYSQFREAFPKQCKKVTHPTKYSVSIATCQIRGRFTWFLPNESIAGVRITFNHDELTLFEFAVRHGETQQDIQAVYGKPDTPKQFQDSHGFDSATYGHKNEYVRLDDNGKLQYLTGTWTRPTFTVSWHSTTYESWRNMAEEDINPVAGLAKALGLGLADHIERVSISKKLS
jgi:hypothetical protein